MVRELQPIDISDTPDVLRLAEEVEKTGVPRVLRSADRDVAVLSPAPSALSKSRQRKRATRGIGLQDIIGIADASDFPDVPDDVSAKKHEYLADTYDANR